jgi:hypothetical protein
MKPKKGVSKVGDGVTMQPGVQVLVCDELCGCNSCNERTKRGGNGDDVRRTQEGE